DLARAGRVRPSVGAGTLTMPCVLGVWGGRASLSMPVFGCCTGVASLGGVQHHYTTVGRLESSKVRKLLIFQLGTLEIKQSKITTKWFSLIVLSDVYLGSKVQPSNFPTFEPSN